MTPETFTADRWVESLRAAYALARGERLIELRGGRVKRFDARGLDPYSECWGKIHLAEELEPVLGLPSIAVSAHDLRTVAREDAYEEFVAEIREPVAA